MKTARELAMECIDAFDRDPIGPPFMPDIIERAIQSAVAAARAEEREECAKMADAERAEYLCNSETCDKAGNHAAATHDIHGAMACERIAAAIRERSRAKDGR